MHNQTNDTVGMFTRRRIFSLTSVYVTQKMMMRRVVKTQQD